MKFTKYPNNPILKPNAKNQWEELCVLNPAAIYNEEDQTFYMVYRAAGNDKTHIIHLRIEKTYFQQVCLISMPILQVCMQQLSIYSRIEWDMNQLGMLYGVIGTHIK